MSSPSSILDEEREEIPSRLSRFPLHDVKQPKRKEALVARWSLPVCELTLQRNGEAPLSTPRELLLGHSFQRRKNAPHQATALPLDA